MKEQEIQFLRCRKVQFVSRHVVDEGSFKKKRIKLVILARDEINDSYRHHQKALELFFISL